VRPGILAAVMVWLAGCGPSGGLQFEIDATADPTASQVAIYVGKGGGVGASIAAELQQPSTLHDGKFWPLAFDSVEILELSATDRTTTISFVSGGDVDKLTVVAIGLTNGQPTSVATKTLASVRADVVEVWELVLQPATEQVDSTVGKAVATWGAQPGETTCVQAVDRSAPLENVFIGVPGDMDCDGYKDGKPEECDDRWHDASTTPSLDRLSCLEEHQVPDPVFGSSDACLFGAPLCVDGKPEARNDCSHLRPYCAPKGLCEVCASDQPAYRFECALGLDPIQNAQQVSFVRCEIDVNMAAMPPLVCDQRLIAAAPPGWFPAGASSCMMRPPLFHASDPATSWSSTVAFGGISLQFRTNPNATACGVEIQPTQMPGVSLDRAEYPQHGLVALQLDSGMGAVAPILVDIRPVSQCDAGAIRNCVANPVLIANETITNCLEHAPLPVP